MARGLNAQAWGWTNFEKGIQKELLGENCLGKIRKVAINVLRQGQEAFLKTLPSQEAVSMPFITGNLHDSIVSVLSDRGRVIAAAYADPVATTPSLLTGKRVYSPTQAFGKRVVGATTAFNWVKGMQGKFPTCIASTLSVTVPYAENPNQLSAKNKRGKHVGYLDMLSLKYAVFMEKAFRGYEAAKVVKWNNRTIGKGYWSNLKPMDYAR